MRKWFTRRSVGAEVVEVEVEVEVEDLLVSFHTDSEPTVWEKMFAAEAVFYPAISKRQDGIYLSDTVAGGWATDRTCNTSRRDAPLHCAHAHSVPSRRDGRCAAGA